VWEFCEQHELLWSYTDKGLQKEMKIASGIPNSSCEDDAFQVFGSATRPKNNSSASDGLMNSLSTYMSNQTPNVTIDPRLVNKLQKLKNEALAIANVAAKRSARLRM
jgi:hypothetical protein